ncbi:hypothetical protein PSACC_00812, partial [Paramicrosporidium saccamoebae]
MRIDDSNPPSIADPGHVRKESWISQLRSMFTTSRTDEAGRQTEGNNMPSPNTMIIEADLDGQSPQSHRKDFSVDTNDSDVSEALPEYVNTLRASSPLRCLPIHVMKLQNGSAASPLPLKKQGNPEAIAQDCPVESAECVEGCQEKIEELQDKLTLRKGTAPVKRERKIRFNSFACLLEAALEGDFEEVKHLIENEGLHPDTCNADGVTSLHCAAGMSRQDMVEYLVDKGANVNVCDDNGWTPLHSSAYTNSLQITDILLSHGGDVEAMDSQGQAPLGLATDFDVIRVLGEAVRRKNSSGRVTALYDFDAANEDNYQDDELSFLKGEQLRIITREDPEWWLAEKDGKEGYVPRRYHVLFIDPQMTMFDTASPLPLELLAQVALHLDYKMILQMRHFSPVTDLLESGHYWHNRTLHISSRSDLRTALSDKTSSQAVRISLAAADIDDTDLSFIAQHFTKIQVLNLTRNPDLTDGGLEALLIAHGPQIKRLNLSRLFRLTNVTMENIAQYCSSLEELSLEGCMVSAAGLRRISTGPSSLRKVSISRCHVLDTQELPAIVQGMSELKVLAMNHIDGVQPYQVQAVIAECPRLRKVELVGCPEITLKAIRQLSSLNKRVQIVHDARLEDHSIDS